MISKKTNMPQKIILIYLLLLFIASSFINISYIDIINDSIQKFLMNGVLVLSLIPMINVGCGKNFGMPIGISAGLLGMCLAIELRLTGMKGILVSMFFGILISLVLGYIYSLILNRVKGDEEIIGTFAGFSFIPLMSFFWTLAPFKNRQMLYPVGGQGLRPKISLDNYFLHSLDNLLRVELGGLSIPIGSLAFFFMLCLFLSYISRTRLGHIMEAVEENEEFANIVGLDINKYRSIGIILSTAIASIGIVVYSQSYGFVHLYDGPFMMAFPAISAILIGGASKGKANIWNVLVGTYLYQTTYLLSVPVANELLVPEISELVRMLVTNGIILYAFLYEGEGGRKNEKKL